MHIIKPMKYSIFLILNFRTIYQIYLDIGRNTCHQYQIFYHILIHIIITSTNEEWLMCIDFRQLNVLEVHGECLRFTNELRNTANHFPILLQLLKLVFVNSIVKWLSL